MVLAVLLFVLSALLACARGWFGFHLARQNGRLLLRIDGLQWSARDEGLLSQASRAGSFGLLGDYRDQLAVNRKQVREYGLTFPVVFQREWETSREYGSLATPRGYLVDKIGVLVSDVAVGSKEILGLAAQRRGSGGRTRLLTLASVDH